MKLEEQVCSLEMSKRLKELGVKQESLFYWDTRKKPEPKISFYGYIQYSQYDIERDDRYVSAFTVAELGRLLPISVYTNKIWYYFRYFMAGQNHEWVIRYISNDDSVLREVIAYEGDCRAEMLVYLLENKLI